MCVFSMEPIERFMLDAKYSLSHWLQNGSLGRWWTCSNHWRPAGNFLICSKSCGGFILSAERNAFSLVGHILAQIIYPKLFPLACYSPERFLLFLIPWSWVPFSHFMLIFFFLKHYPSHSCMLKSYLSFKIRTIFSSCLSLIAPHSNPIQYIPIQLNPTSLASHNGSACKIAVEWDLGSFPIVPHQLAAASSLGW